MAIRCIQVPTSEMIWPPKKSLKFRCRKARIACFKVAPLSCRLTICSKLPKKQIDGHIGILGLPDQRCKMSLGSDRIRPGHEKQLTKVHQSACGISSRA